MNITPTKIKDVVILEPEETVEQQDYLLESVNKEIFEKLDLHRVFVQDSQARTLRGLHFQKDPKAQGKVVHCTKGAIYTVVVDIRKGSPTYREWIGVILSSYNKRQLIVPNGFAHGFCTLVPNTRVAYKVDESYSPEATDGILWNDPELGIDWPITNPVLSERDVSHPVLAEANLQFVYDGRREGENYSL